MTLATVRSKGAVISVTVPSVANYKYVVGSEGLAVDQVAVALWSKTMIWLRNLSLT